MKRISTLALAATLTMIPATIWAHHVPAGGLSHAEIEKLSSNPKTPADHMKLAKQYSMEAAAYDTDAKEFEAIAAASKAMPKIAASATTGAELARKTGDVYRAMAAEHEALSKKK
jgi:hypothetical protein